MDEMACIKMFKKSQREAELGEELNITKLNKQRHRLLPQQSHPPAPLSYKAYNISC